MCYSNSLWKISMNKLLEKGGQKWEEQISEFYKVIIIKILSHTKNQFEYFENIAKWATSRKFDPINYVE